MPRYKEEPEGQGGRGMAVAGCGGDVPYISWRFIPWHGWVWRCSIYIMVVVLLLVCLAPYLQLMGQSGSLTAVMAQLCSAAIKLELERGHLCVEPQSLVLLLTSLHSKVFLVHLQLQGVGIIWNGFVLTLKDIYIWSKLSIL